MPAHIRSASGSGGWKSISSMFIRTVAGSGGWKNITQGWIRISQGVGGWRQFFSSLVTPSIEQTVTISKSGNYHNPSNIITLTGTKYHFANASVFSYRFYRSADQVTWTPMTSETITTNPSSGSSSTVSYSLQTADFTSTTMYFKFEYTATNTTYSTTATSTSNIVSVTYLDIPAPPSGFPNINQSTISVASTASSGTWIGSPTLYDWKWQYGPSNLTLTYQANRTISYASISGTTATITAFDHGFKSGDTVSISGVNDLYNVSNITISSVFTNFFSYTITKTAWSFLLQYNANEYVSYGGNIYKALIATPSRSTYSVASAYTSNISYVDYNSQMYRANISVPSVSTWNASTVYSAGTVVAYNGTRWTANLTNQGQTPSTGNYIYWSQTDTTPNNSTYWTLINIYPGGSYWELQSGTTNTSGTATGPNYHEGSSSSPISYTINSFPSTDYKTGTSLLSLTTRMNVSAYNAAFSGSANSTPRTIYEYPSFFFGAQTITATTASIIYAEAYMSVYDIDVRTGGVSISGYPKTNQANSSPISITGLTAGTSYTVYVTPKNADSPRVSGVQKTTTFTTPSPPGTPTISFSSVGTNGFNVSWSSSGATAYNVDIKNTSSALSIANYPKNSTTLVSDAISGLLSGTQYTVYVTGLNSAGSSAQTTASQYTNVTLSYNANSATGGSVPSSGEYSYNATATVAGNPNSLSRTYATWAGWSLATDGSGTIYGPGYTTTITMNQSRQLYARWLANIPGIPSINSVSYSPASPTASSNSLVFSGVNFGSDTQSVLLEWGTTTSYSSGSTSVSTNGGSYTTPANLTANTTYYWRARGYNPVYNGYGSPVTGSVYIPTAITAPSAPTSLSVDNITYTSARINWQAPTNDGGASITRYEVNRDGASFFNVGNVFNYVYTLSAGTYTIGVRAVNSVGAGTAAYINVTIPTFTVPTCVAPSLQFQRVSSSSFLRWYCDYPTPSGDWTSITGMQFEIRTTAGGGTLLASGTRAYPGAGVYPYNAAGTIWAFKAGVDGQVSDISYSSSARFGRARVVMLGANGSTYFGTWSSWI